VYRVVDGVFAGCMWVYVCRYVCGGECVCVCGCCRISVCVYNVCMCEECVLAVCVCVDVDVECAL